MTDSDIKKRIAKINRVVNRIKQFARDNGESAFDIIAEITSHILIDDMMETMMETYKNKPDDPDTLVPCVGCAAGLITDTNRLDVFIENVTWCLQNVQEGVHGEDEDQPSAQQDTYLETSKSIH